MNGFYSLECVCVSVSIGMSVRESEYSLIVCQLVQILNAAFEFILLNLFALLTKDQRDKRSERGSEFFVLILLQY